MPLASSDVQLLFRVRGRERDEVWRPTAIVTSDADGEARLIQPSMTTSSKYASTDDDVVPRAPTTSITLPRF